MSNLRTYIYAAVVAVAVGAMVLGGYSCGKKSQQAAIASLATELAQSEKTVEIKQGLYATTIIQMNGLTGLLDTSKAEVAALKKQLDDSQAQLLTTQQLAITWKKAYEGAVAATQTDSGGKPPDGTDPVAPGRLRVDFTKDFGPITASGYTLTNPPEGYLKLEQVRPLVLGVSVAKNKDGTWSTYVTSSDPNMDVKVNLGVVDVGVTDPTWKQRIWADLGVGFLGGQNAMAGLSYHFDRWSLGAACTIAPGSQGCGLTMGYRLFQ